MLMLGLISAVRHRAVIRNFSVFFPCRAAVIRGVVLGHGPVLKCEKKKNQKEEEGDNTNPCQVGSMFIPVDLPKTRSKPGTR